MSPDLDLTGTWQGNDGGLYFLRQSGGLLSWAGLSSESARGVNDFHLGLEFTNVYRGNVSGSSIAGEWADVPRGRSLQNGTLELEITSPTELRRQAATGGFGGSNWQRTDLPAPIGIRTRFDRVQRNDGDSMHGHLKMYKDFVVVYGQVTGDLTKSCPADASRRYANFMCNVDGDFDEDDFDGDINFDVRADRTPQDNSLGTALDAQANFFDPATGWFNNPDHIRAKLDDSDNHLHCEIIMYGRSAGKDDCQGNVPPLLPGWMEDNSNSVLFQGSPINGDVLTADAGPFPVRIFNQNLPLGTRVRVTGFLALDCHGGDCDEDDPHDHNEEIHPVYALEIINPANLPDLTGVWGASDVGTYYVRQLGGQIWWLGLSHDEGRTFANVFRGALAAGGGSPGTEASIFIVGDWVDVPLGATQNSGQLTLARSNATALDLERETGGFGGCRWEKLYDRGQPIIPPG